MEENFNKHLGNKLKLRRLALGLTQTKVAKAINVTFQQIQKYEKGTNGVSSIRLLQLSNYLKVPINYFFEDFSEYAINSDKINEALIDVGINDPDRVKNSYSFELSGGMAQRVVIALATFSKPRLLFADEPTTGLDVTVERQLLDNFFDFVKNKSMTLVLVTHDLGIVAQYCDEALVMYKGEIVEKGSVNEIFKNPKDSYTQQLIKASSEDIS